MPEKILETSDGFYRCHIATPTIVTVHIEDDLFKDGVLDLQRLNPALYLGSDKYITASSEEIKYINRKEYGKV